MSEPTKPTAAETSPVEPKSKSRHWLARLLDSSRYMVMLAVIGTFVGSAVLLLVGISEVVYAIVYAVQSFGDVHSGELKAAMIESVDTFLVATVLFLIALGLYQLFVNSSIALPAWLQTQSVEDLEHRLAGLVIVVLAVIFLTQAFQWEGGIGILWFGLSAGVVILAVASFLQKTSHH